MIPHRDLTEKQATAYDKLTDDYCTHLNEIYNSIAFMAKEEIPSKCAYKYTLYSEMYRYFTENIESITDEKLDLIINAKDFLGDLYTTWMDGEYSIVNQIEDCINETITTEEV
jgi:hypothetical protein